MVVILSNLHRLLRHAACLSRSTIGMISACFNSHSPNRVDAVEHASSSGLPAVCQQGGYAHKVVHVRRQYPTRTTAAKTITAQGFESDTTAVVMSRQNSLPLSVFSCLKRLLSSRICKAATFGASLGKDEEDSMDIVRSKTRWTWQSNVKSSRTLRYIGDRQISSYGLLHVSPSCHDRKWEKFNIAYKQTVRSDWVLLNQVFGHCE